MGKNIVITLLVIISLGFLVLSFYHQTIAEKVMSEMQMKLDECAMTAEKLQESSKLAMQKAEAHAVVALQEAKNQRIIAEEALAKCK